MDISENDKKYILGEIEKPIEKNKKIEEISTESRVTINEKGEKVYHL